MLHQESKLKVADNTSSTCFYSNFCDYGCCLHYYIWPYYLVSIDLDDASFSTLQSRGWMNFRQQNMLLLKLNDTTYRAFTNSCPHAGSRNAWSYNDTQERFVCSSHNNSYPSDCSSPGTTDDVLECYDTSLMGSTLTVTKS